MNNRFLMWPLVLGATVTGSLHALEISGQVSALLEHTDNARRNDDDKISELQQEISAEISGTHGGESVTADFRYRADRRFYSEDSQDDQSVLEGMASLRWEQIDQTLFWDLQHTRKDVLRDSALVDIRENRDERDITEISPLYIMRLTPTDSLQARLNYSMITYREAEALDSERYGGSLTYAHQISPTDSFFLTGESNEVDFDSNLQDDYRYDALTTSYRAQLSRLTYSVTLGYNQANREEGDDFSGPVYGADVRYDDGVNQWYGRLDSRITDSSLGDENRSIFDGVDIGDTTLGVADVVEKTTMEVGVISQGVCTSCQLRAAIFYDQEDYDTQPRDNDEYGFEADGSYRLSTLSELRATYRYRSTEYSGANARSDYDQHELRLEYSRRLTQELSGEVYVGHATRDGAGLFGSSYDENIVGIRLSYLFR